MALHTTELTLAFWSAPRVAAHALIRSGCVVATSYPGSPVVGIAEELRALAGEGLVQFRYATNEKVAFEMAAAAAYAQAGVEPRDLDLVELQDTDAARAILSVEELGLCARGHGGRWVREGGGEMTSAQPVNPSGGLLSKGEPLGASALAQVIEIVSQLRGACGARQVADARLGLAHTVGRGANACVVVLAR